MFKRRRRLSNDSLHSLRYLVRVPFNFASPPNPFRYHFTCVDLSEPEAQDISQFFPAAIESRSYAFLQMCLSARRAQRKPVVNQPVSVSSSPPCVHPCPAGVPSVVCLSETKREHYRYGSVGLINFSCTWCCCFWKDNISTSPFRHFLLHYLLS